MTIEQIEKGLPIAEKIWKLKRALRILNVEDFKNQKVTIMKSGGAEHFYICEREGGFLIKPLKEAIETQINDLKKELKDYE